MGSFGISSILLTPFTSTFIDKFGKKIIRVNCSGYHDYFINFICIFKFNDFIIYFKIISRCILFNFFNSSSALASDNLQDNNRKKGLSIFYSSTIFPYFVGPFFGELIILNYGYVYFFLFFFYFFSFLALLIIIKLIQKLYK